MKGTDNQQIYHLPKQAYVSEEWFKQEQKKIFSRTWRYAGLVEDISEPGDFLAIQAGLNNIFILRGQDHHLRAFHNICRHRGTQLLRSAGKGGKVITCPYHDWTYNDRGDLISVPEQQTEFSDIDKKCHGLKPAAVDSWRGMFFVHPDPDASALQTWFAPIEPYLGPHQIETLVEYPEGATSHLIKANWKIVVENYIDVYHLSHLHSGTLSMYDHKKAEYGFCGPHFAFWEPLQAIYAENIEENAPYPLIVPKEQLGSWVPMLFPGLGLAESESSWSLYHITPLAPDLTRVETRTRLKNVSNWTFGQQSWRSASFWQDRIRGKYAQGTGPDDPMTSGDFMAEDIYVCEQQQKSLQSPYFEVGPIAQNREQPILDHQKIVLDFMKA